MIVPVGFSGTGERSFIAIGEDRCRTILDIIWCGWKKAVGLSEVVPNLCEVEITERLRQGMRCALKDESLFPQGREIWISPGSESHSSEASLKPDGLTDIPISFTKIREMHHEHDPHAIIECKRVSGTDAGLARLYVVSGIDRFKNGKYASQHAVGFMIGYLLSGDVDTAVGRINRYLAKKKREAEHLQQSILIVESRARSSRHYRPDLRKPICLHHTFLRFRNMDF